MNMNPVRTNIAVRAIIQKKAPSHPMRLMSRKK